MSDQENITESGVDVRRYRHERTPLSEAEAEDIRTREIKEAQAMVDEAKGFLDAVKKAPLRTHKTCYVAVLPGDSEYDKLSPGFNPKYYQGSVSWINPTT